MRKTFLTVLLIAVMLGSAFASNEVMLGLSSGFNQEISFEKTIITDKIKTEAKSIVPLKADAMFYLGDSFALNTAAGMDIYLPKSDLGDTSVGFVADILAYYRAELGDSFDFLLGGGASYKYKSRGEDVRTSNHSIALLASLRLQLEAADHIVIFAGGDIGYNVWNESVISGGNHSHSVNSDETIMPWAVKAGISYKF